MLTNTEDQGDQPALAYCTRVCDEINTMARKIEDEAQGMQSKYGGMVKSISSSTARGGDRPDRKAASKTPSVPLQAQAMHGMGLKREGAIANIRAMDQDGTNANPRSDLMEINNGYNGYILLTYYSCFHC